MKTRPPREGEKKNIVKTPYGKVYGTLLIPQGKQPVDAVLLVAGSGPTDRDGNSELIVENNDMLWHLAQELHKAGIASLRYDKMGVGESSFEDNSNEQNFSFEDSVHVARMLVSSMHADSRIRSIGIIGHSEGSLTGLLAAGDPHVDFFISLAGNGDPIASQLTKQVRGIDRDAALLLEKRLDQIQMSHYEITGNAIVDSLIPPGSEVYLGSWMKFDPNALLRTISVPTLVVKGDRDERLVAEGD